jgi:hypothetical protein
LDFQNKLNKTSNLKAEDVVLNRQWHLRFYANPQNMLNIQINVIFGH